MSALLHASPPFEAYRSEPFSVDEIDAHPDAGRIWATIDAVKALAEKAEDVIRGEIDAAAESAAECARDDTEGECARALKDVLHNIPKHPSAARIAGIEKAMPELHRLIREWE